MSLHEDFRFPSQDGSCDLYGQQWMPETKTPRAVIQIVHGISEHGGRYASVAERLTGQGFLVVAEDHLGHGNTPQSPEDMGYTADRDGWIKMCDNVHALRERYGALYPDIPYFLLGHSMGSFLSRSYLIRYPGTVDGCILSGTGWQPQLILWLGIAACAIEKLRIGPRRHSKFLNALCFGAYNKQFSPNRTEEDWISSDPAAVDAYLADPFCRVKASVTLMSDMLKGISFNEKPSNLGKMDPETPVYFFSGDEDPVGSNGTGVQKSRDAFLAAGCKNVSMRLYPKGRHEMFNEFQREQVIEDLLSWLESQL